MTSHGCGGALPFDLIQEPVLLDSGVLLLEVAGSQTKRGPPWPGNWCSRWWHGMGPSVSYTVIRGRILVLKCRLFGICKTRTMLYHPRRDGFIKRSFRTLGRCLTAACRETRDEWDVLVPFILASMGVVPNMMMLWAVA